MSLKFFIQDIANTYHFFITFKLFIMKQEQNVQFSDFKILERLKLEYADLLQSSPFSLQKLFAPENFQFDEFCKEFSPYVQSDELIGIAEAFGQQYGVWQVNTRHYINCALLLYPKAEFDRMLTIMKNLTIGFYLNDVMGREIFKFLTGDQQQEYSNMIHNMANLDETLDYLPDATSIEIANATVLREFRNNSPKEWFKKFKRLYSHHIDITHRDCNTDSQGHIPDIYEYMERRCHLAGMNHIVLWIEYSSGKFLEWGSLKANKISQKLERLHWLTAAFGALSNDLFSFEKEVIDYGSDSNLVAIIALNNQSFSLKEAIERASEIVRTLVMELIAVLDIMNVEIEKLDHVDPTLALQLTVHLKGLVRFVQASWLWQLHAKRYKRTKSIWVETTLANKAVASAF